MNNKKNRWVAQGVRHLVAKEAKGVCFHCKKKASRADISTRGHLRFFDENDNTYHIDHIIPRSKGGTDDKKNLVLSCPTCNMGIRNKKASNDTDVLAILKDING
jgi:5-methylcytosine-specific restriction endonuclease McrA